MNQPRGLLDMMRPFGGREAGSTPAGATPSRKTPNANVLGSPPWFAKDRPHPGDRPLNVMWVPSPGCRVPVPPAAGEGVAHPRGIPFTGRGIIPTLLASLQVHPTHTPRPHYSPSDKHGT